MIILNIQMNNLTIESIINFINTNSVLNALSTIIGIISFIQEFLERYREKKWLKFMGESVMIFVTLAILCKINSWSFAMLVVSTLIFIMTYRRRAMMNNQAKVNINNKDDSQISNLLSDSMEKDYAPKVLDFSQSSFKNAEQCLAEARPKEAISYLNKCKEKVKNQVRFTTRYADALIMLDNYSGALSKLNNLSEVKLKKKRKYKNVMIRKAACYHGLNKHVEELDCYDKVIVSNYKPEKYYFYRGKVKVRLLEIYPYVKTAEKAVLHTQGSKQKFILSAIADFDKALKYGDKYKAEILSYMGSCYFYLSEYQKALDFLYESVSLTDALANNYVYFGLYYYENGNLDTAETYLKKGIDYNADNEVPYLFLAKINYKNDLYDKAIAYAASALSILPSIDECYGIQGDCYTEKCMYSEAIKCYTQAIECKEKAGYFESRAYCYYNKQKPKYRNAYNDILKVLELNDTDSYRLRAILYKAEMDHEEGREMDINELRNLINPYSENPQNYNAIGIILFEYGYFDEAEEYYKKAIEYDATKESPHYNLAILLRDTGRPEEAVKHLKEAIASNSMNIKFFTLLKKCYKDLNDISNEIAIQNDIKDLKQKYLIVNKKNGDAVYKVKKYYEAEKYYRSALCYIADDSATLNNLACALYYQERYEEAIKYLDNAVARSANYYLAYFNLGNCYLRIGSKKENENLAKEKYQIALRFFGHFEPAKNMLESMNPSAIKMIIDDGK
ncbi:MAG: tetratricopeptide repeat protein [Lachnospiraceae bacterium]|nr:tetratricopeptide repeat protein [Lachnospiraceae bacterium]